MKEKYIEERFPRYYEFGSSAIGKVDIASTENETLATVTGKQADKLISDRAAAIDMISELSSILNDLDPIAFKQLWYG